MLNHISILLAVNLVVSWSPVFCAAVKLFVSSISLRRLGMFAKIDLGIISSRIAVNISRAKTKQRHLRFFLVRF